MYNELYAAWQREITANSLGALPPDFYVKIAVYLKRIKEEARPDQKTVKLNLLEHEAQNVDRMLKELLELRYRKIIKAITKTQCVPTEFLAAEEAKMTQTFATFAEAYQAFSKSLIEGEPTQISTAPEPIKVVIRTETPPSAAKTQPTLLAPQTHVTHKRQTLRFTKAIPAIMGADMKSYGPFQAEDVASLPELNAKILVKQGLAVPVEVS